MAEATIELTFKMVQTVEVENANEADAHLAAIAAGHDMEVDYPDGSGSIGPVEVNVLSVEDLDDEDDDAQEELDEEEEALGDT